MKLTGEEMKELYQQQTTRSARPSSACLSEDVLGRAAAGELGQPEREQVADHLMACSDCTQEYRLLRSLKPWAAAIAASAGEPAPEAKAAVAWRATGPQLRREERIGAPRPAWWQWLAEAFSPAHISYAIAASLLIVGLAFGVWIVSLRQENQRIAARVDQQLAERDQAIASAKQSLEEAARRSRQYETQIAELRQNLAQLSQTVDELSQPQINVPITDLDSRDSARGGKPGAVTTIRVPSSANLFTLILNVAGEQSYASYALEIMDQRGKLIWRGGGLQKSPDNTFTVALPRRLLPEGQYRIRLYGLRGSQKQLVEDYAVRIHYRP